MVFGEDGAAHVLLLSRHAETESFGGADVTRPDNVSGASEAKARADDMVVNHAQLMTAPEPVKAIRAAEAQAPEPAQDGAAMIKGTKGSLPEGFFDNVDADYRARGLEPPKYDIQ